MKYYSEILKKMYDDPDLLKKEEEEQVEREAAIKAEREAHAAERKARAKEVEEALAEAQKADAHYHELLRAFCKDYGAFHTTVSFDKLHPTDWMDELWRSLF